MHIVAAMSGGVDSSVAAALLLEQGHTVTGAFLRNGVAPGAAARRHKQGCCSVGDSLDAARVCDRLDIPFYSLDFSQPFERLIDDFAASYAAGRTPNPCVDCNKDLKFGRLQQFAEAIGAGAVATGHYAHLEEHAGRHALRVPADRAKDQTYVLFPLDQAQLSRTLFPLAGLQKAEVRERARALGLDVSEKPESMEICFVPEGDYRAIVAERAPDGVRPGDIRDAATGTVVGRHAGIGTVTIGQRRGLGLPGGADARFVTRLDTQTNEVWVDVAGALERREVVVQLWNGVAAPPPAPGERLVGNARVRRGHVGQSAVAVGEQDERGVAQVRVTFDPPVRSPAPGQALVLYDECDRVLGGGWIASSV